MKFGLLAEIRWGRGLRGVHEPNLLSGIFFYCLKMIQLLQNMKKRLNTPPPSHPHNCLKILKDSLKNSIILPVVSRVYQMSYKFSIKLFYVLKGVDLNKTIKKNRPDDGAQIGGRGRGQRRFSQKPKFHFFLSLP